MSYQFKFLSKDSMPEIYETFVEAFSDYALDMSYITEESMYNRAIKNGIDFECSVGVFDKGKMTGFTQIGIDQWKNVPAAYDIGTGIIKPYRGKGIAKEMFAFAIPRLKEKNVQKFVLEVLQENEPAVKAYKKTGFSIVRKLDCFEVQLEKAEKAKETEIPLEVQSVPKESLSSFEAHLDWQPSWENSFSSIKRIPDELLLFTATQGKEDAGLLVYYPALNWIMCMVVKKNFRRMGVGSFLLEHLVQNSNLKQPKVKLVNVEHSDQAMINFLTSSGFEIYAKQFEMEFALT